MDVAQIGWVNHVISCVYVLEYCCVFNLFAVHLIQQVVSEHVGVAGAERIAWIVCVEVFIIPGALVPEMDGLLAVLHVNVVVERGCVESLLLHV